jgi:hypothetical protein
LTNFLYRRKSLLDQYSKTKDQIDNIEINTNTLAPLSNPTVTQSLIFQFQSTNNTGAVDGGQCRINATTTPTSTVDEDTNANVVAYANFDDVGGNGTGVLATSPMFNVPLLENKAKTANYHFNPAYPAWDNSNYPSVTHTKQFIASNAFKCNVPGIATLDQSAYVFYASNTAFNISANISASLWFYPTDLSGIGAEVFRFLLYRWIDASNWFIVAIKSSDDKVYVFTNEAAAQVKFVSTAAVTANAWHNVIFTYNPSTNALALYLDNVLATVTPADTAPNVYTADANMYIGGLPGLPAKRFTGYIDNFVFWSPLVLTGTQVTNMWTHGTIV